MITINISLDFTIKKPIAAESDGRTFASQKPAGELSHEAISNQAQREF